MTEPKYVGMMFTPESIQQIVAGNKTQTRRPVRQKHEKSAAYFYVEEETQYSYRDKKGSAWLRFDGTFYDHKIPAPVAKGDIIYVKEAWRLFDSSVECSCYDQCGCAGANGKPMYKMDNWSDETPYKSPMYMPKMFARHFLEVLDVRVERLQDISPADAIAEGIEVLQSGMFKDYSGMAEHGFTSEKKSYATMYDYVNRGKNRPKWADNPLVFDISFRYLENHKPPFQ